MMIIGVERRTLYWIAVQSKKQNTLKVYLVLKRPSTVRHYRLEIIILIHRKFWIQDERLQRWTSIRADCCTFGAAHNGQSHSEQERCERCIRRKSTVPLSQNLYASLRQRWGNIRQFMYLPLRCQIQGYTRREIDQSEIRWMLKWKGFQEPIRPQYSTGLFVIFNWQMKINNFDSWIYAGWCAFLFEFAPFLIDIGVTRPMSLLTICGVLRNVHFPANTPCRY